MAKTYGLGSVSRRTRGGPYVRKMDNPKTCRLCGEEWWPRTGPAAGLRDICYSVRCENARKAERCIKANEAAKARRVKKQEQERESKK